MRWGKCWDSSEMHVLDTYQHQRQPSIEYGRRAKRGGGEGGIFRIFLSLTLNSLHPPQAWSPLGFIQKLRIPKYNWSHRRIENSNLCFYIQNLLNAVGLNKLVRAKVKEALPRKNNEFTFHSLLFRVFVNLIVGGGGLTSVGKTGQISMCHKHNWHWIFTPSQMKFWRLK